MRRALVALALFTSLSASASTYTVDDLADSSDNNPGDDICATVDAVCTLRAAIEEANAHAGADTIEFSVAGTISPATAFDPITEPTTIDGTTAPGYTSAPVVIVDGAFSVAVGLHFDLGSDASLLDGMQLYGFSTTAVLVDADGVTIRRNYLGPIPAGTPNTDGLQLNGTGSLVGGADGDGNVISGNDQHGIAVTGADHVIKDNFIGTDATCACDLANGDDGINVSSASGISIGSETAGEENVISGNFDCGVQIDSGIGNVIAGNFIGTDVTGASAIPNFIGIYVSPDAPGNTIGTTAARNVISGNDDDGIDIDADDTVVQNNYVGTDVTGAIGIGNLGFGITAFFASNVDIGGSAAGEGNVVSFNGAEGIFFVEVTASSITGNLVGTDATGTSILGNGLEGILLVDSSGITIDGNTVSGNSTGGIVDAGGIDNILESNRVGTTIDGDAALGNLGTGIELFATVDDIVRSNVVSANDGHGVEMTFGAAGTLVHSNIVGLSADLTTPLGNAFDGINVCDAAVDTVVGSVALGGNTISANGDNGIGVEPSALQNNTWAANSIDGNDDLGIDIEIDGVTANDDDDPDEGANNLQNFPDLTNAVTTPTASQILGTINTLPSTAFTLHFYSSPAADPSGYGEGATYLGTVSGTTDVNGDASFVFTGPALTVGDVVTATATTSDGTSEFSEAEDVVAAPTISFSSATYAIGEAGVSITINVIRSGDLDAVSTVQYATTDDTATAGSDYTSASGTITFNPGEAEKSFVVPITNDTTDEPDEIVDLTLSNPTAATLSAPSAAELTITDDDLPPSISIKDVPLSEGDSGTTTFAFEVTLSEASAFTITVDTNTADGTADSSDYTAIPTTTLTFDPGETTQGVTVNVAGDVTFEDDETFLVNLLNATNASIGDDEAQGTIVNDDAEPAVTIDDVSLAEGVGNFTFTLSLTNPSENDITINYMTADGTADSSDYTAQTNVATILAGNMSTTVNVPVTADALDEPDETFFVNLPGVTNATIADDQGTGTILDDDAQPTITIDDVSLNEGNAGTTNFDFTVTLSAASGSDVTINYMTANGSASAGSDYTSQTNSVTILAGDTTATITIAVTGDPTTESNETFFVNLTGATNAAISDDQALGTIQNDDAQPTVIVDDVSLNEGDGGTTNFTFTLTLSNPSASNVTVNFTTANDTATAGSDYTAQTNSATILAGNTSGSITIAVTGDVTFENSETFFVNLTGATNAAISDNQGLGTIQNDDAQPTVIIDDVSLSEGDGGTTNFTFTLTLSNPSASNVTVNFTTANDTATAGSDYTAQTNSTTILAGNTSGSITIAVTGDVTFENTETFFVNLTGATNATVVDSQGLGTIQNDDQPPSVFIADVSQAEGNAGTSNFNFAVTLNTTAGTDITVTWQTADGSASSASDYTAASGVATIVAGNTGTTIPISVNGDTSAESDETFFVNLLGSNGTILDNQAVGEILDDDTVPLTADLTIAKIADTTTFVPGQQVTYTITVENLGPAIATGITVTDVIPPGTTYVSASGPDATCAGTSTVVCTIPSLASGASTTITLVVTAFSTGPISNTATVAAAAPADDTPANNAAGATITPAAAAGADIPTVSEWGLLLLALALGALALRRL